MKLELVFIGGYYIYLTCITIDTPGSVGGSLTTVFCSSLIFQRNHRFWILKKSKSKNPLILGIYKNENERTIWFWVFQKQWNQRTSLGISFNNSRIKEL